MLELKNITKKFYDTNGGCNTVIKNLNITVPDGQFVSIVGSNGTGKSTLLNIISRSMEADEGEIILGGNNITNTPEHLCRRIINKVFQNPEKNTCSNMTVRENLAMSMKKEKLFSLSKCLSFKDDIYIDAISNFSPKLLSLLDVPIGSLSGGQRQSISLLMASLSHPKLLLLDEHTAALDPKTSEEVIELTGSIVKEKKITTLMVTHNLKHATKYGDRIIMLHQGEVIMDISGEEKRNLTVESILKKFDYAV